MEGLKRVRLSVLPEFPNSGYEKVFFDYSIQSPTMELPYVSHPFENYLNGKTYYQIHRLNNDDNTMVLSNLIIFNNWRKLWKI